VVATLPGGDERFSPEYEACAAAARQHGAPLDEVQRAAHQHYEMTKDRR
jgi:uncharacterized protein (DUF111 family)